MKLGEFSDHLKSSTPQRQVKVHYTVLERQLEDQKLKFKELKVILNLAFGLSFIEFSNLTQIKFNKTLYDALEKACRYLTFEFNKHKPVLTDLGFFKQKKTLQRSISNPEILLNQDDYFERTDVDKLTANLDDSRFFKNFFKKYIDSESYEVASSDMNLLNQSIELLNLSDMSNLEKNIAPSSNNNNSSFKKDSEEKYFEKLFYIYNCFKVEKFYFKCMSYELTLLKNLFLK